MVEIEESEKTKGTAAFSFCSGNGHKVVIFLRFYLFFEINFFCRCCRPEPVIEKVDEMSVNTASGYYAVRL